MKPRWRKVIHDLLDSKARTLLVVFSIAVGVFSIGVIAGAYQIIASDMSASYSANRPANVEIRMANFDEDTLALIQNQHGVQDAEARRVFNMRVRVPGTEKWTTLDMTAITTTNRLFQSTRSNQRSIFFICLPEAGAAVMRASWNTFPPRATPPGHESPDDPVVRTAREGAGQAGIPPHRVRESFRIVLCDNRIGHAPPT